VAFSPNKRVNDSYRRCRSLQLRHDPTYFAATACLPAERRPALYALYGYVRGADEIADDTRLNGQRLEALDAWQDALEQGIDRGYSLHPVIAALVDAGPRYGMPLELLPEYMESMRADCDDQVRMRSQAQLDRYMAGTATVGPVAAPLLDAPETAIALLRLLGVAFQLTNFIRDVPLDWQMGRVYLPGLSEDDLARRTASDALRDHVAQQVARARQLFADSEALAQLLPSAVRPGIKVARAVYLRVLDRVEENGYDVVTRSNRLRPWEAVQASSWALVS
jgi:15-cis-phytoene synthase